MDIHRHKPTTNRNWHPAPPATEDDIRRLKLASPVPLPEPLCQLLRQTNGGEGDLALPPLFFVLDNVDEIISGMKDPYLQNEFKNLLFFGGNGGLERIAVDWRQQTQPYSIVMIDPVAGPESAEKIADDIETFIAAIGHEFLDSEAAQDR